MQRYFFQIHGAHGTDDDSVGVVLSGYTAAMLRAVTMCAEIGCSGGFCLGFAVSVRNEDGAVIGRVSVVLDAAVTEARHV